MPVRYYTTVEVAGTLGVETVDTLLTSTRAEPKRLVGIFATEYTATENDDARIRVYLERERIVDISIRHLISAFDTSARCVAPWIPLDLLIPEGETVKVGHVSGGTASDIVYTAAYELTAAR